MSTTPMNMTDTTQTLLIVVYSIAGCLIIILTAWAILYALPDNNSFRRLLSRKLKARPKRGWPKDGFRYTNNSEHVLPTHAQTPMQMEEIPLENIANQTSHGQQSQQLTSSGDISFNTLERQTTTVSLLMRSIGHDQGSKSTTTSNSALLDKDLTKETNGQQTMILTSLMRSIAGMVKGSGMAFCAREPLAGDQLDIGQPQIDSELKARLTRKYRLKHGKMKSPSRYYSDRLSTIPRFTPMSRLDEMDAMDSFDLESRNLRKYISPLSSPLEPAFSASISSSSRAKDNKRVSEMTVFNLHPGAKMLV